MSVDRLGIGGNQPPSEAELHRERIDALIANANRWAAERPEITDAEMAARAAQFLDQLTAEEKKLDAQRRAEKAPHERAAKAVDLAWRPLLDALDACKRLIKPLHTRWLRREEERVKRTRIEAQAAALQARDAAATAAAERASARTVQQITAVDAAEKAAREAEAALAALPDHAQVRGHLGGRAHSLRTTWKAVILDIDATFAHYRDHPDVLETLTKLANASARAGVRQVPGCDIFSEQN